MIGLLILQLFVVKAPPPPTQAEAIRILLASPGASNVANWPEPPSRREPRVTFTGATGPSLGPWDWPAPLPRTRLDGSPLSSPPAVYGIPFPLWSVPLWSTPARCQECNGARSGRNPPDPHVAHPVQ